jgi:hypothetical protein
MLASDRPFCLAHLLTNLCETQAVPMLQADDLPVLIGKSIETVV